MIHTHYDTADRIRLGQASSKNIGVHFITLHGSFVVIYVIVPPPLSLVTDTRKKTTSFQVLANTLSLSLNNFLKWTHYPLHPFQIRIWNLPKRECIRRINAHDGFVRGLCFNPDGQSFFSCGDDKTVKQWSMEAPEHGEDPEPINTIIGKVLKPRYRISF